MKPQIKADKNNTHLIVFILLFFICYFNHCTNQLKPNYYGNTNLQPILQKQRY